MAQASNVSPARAQASARPPVRPPVAQPVKRPPAPSAAPARPPARPVGGKPPLVAPSALAAAINSSADENLLPPLELCTVDWQGGKGDGKTTAALGNPWGVCLKFCDGTFLRTRCAAEVRMIRTLGDFDKNIEELLRIAERDGPTGKYRTLIIDPTFMWQNMLADRYLAEVNALNAARSKPGDELPQYRSIREHPDGPKKYFPLIADDVARTIEKFMSCGWGVHTCTHYKQGLIVEDNSMSTAHGGWVPDVARGVAGAIDKYMVLRAVCEVVSVPIDGGSKKIYDVSFDSTKFSGAGSSRVPLAGDIDLPDYSDPGTPPGITSFMVIRKAVAQAAKRACAAETAFQSYIAAHPLTAADADE